MRTSAILLTLPLLAAVVGCKPESPAAEERPIRSVVVIPKPIRHERPVVGQVKPRYESDLSFRVAGKLLARLIDVGAAVKQGDTLAALDTQDHQNRLCAAEAGVSSAQLNYTELKAEFDGVVTAVGAEAGQNVTPGQLVVRLARPGDKDAVFSIADTAIGDRTERAEVLVWPLSNPDVRVKGEVREISPLVDSATRTYTVKVALKDPSPEMRYGMSIGGRWKGSSVPVIALPLSALFERNGAPAVWLFNRPSGSVMLKHVTVARYEADTVIIRSGVATGDIVVTAGINMLRENQKVRLAAPASMAAIP